MTAAGFEPAIRVLQDNLQLLFVDARQAVDLNGAGLTFLLAFAPHHLATLAFGCLEHKKAYVEILAGRVKKAKQQS